MSLIYNKFKILFQSIYFLNNKFVERSEDFLYTTKSVANVDISIKYVNTRMASSF